MKYELKFSNNYSDNPLNFKPNTFSHENNTSTNYTIHVMYHIDFDSFAFLVDSTEVTFKLTDT